MQQARHRLCSEIVKQHFGQTAKRIFTALLNEGQTLEKLLKHNEISHHKDKMMINENDNHQLVQKSLKTLIQHHVVRYYEHKSSDKKSSHVYYEADIDSVEMRLHFPHFINIVKMYENNNNSLQLAIEFAHLLIQYLCEHGECTKQQLFDLWAHTIYNILDDIQTNCNTNSNNNDDDNDIYINNNKKYSFSLQFNMTNFGEWTRSMSMKSKQEKKKEIRHHFKLIFKWLLNEKRFIIQKQSASKKRKSPFTDSDHPKKLRKLRGNEKVSMDMDHEEDVNDNDEIDPKYIICYRSLLHEMRCDIIRDFVSQKYDSKFCDITDVIYGNSLCILRTNYANILDAVWLNFNEKEELRQVFKHSVLEHNTSSPIENRYSIGKQLYNDDKEHYNLPFAAAFEYIYNVLNSSIKEDQLHDYLNILSDGNEIINELNNILPVLIKSNMNEEYHVNVSGIIEYIQKLDVQQIIHSRFDTLEVEQNQPQNDGNEADESQIMQSNDASLLFGALISMRKIGDKQLSEICMMKHTTVKKVLYRMLADKFIESEYIPRSADRDPKKSLFLWSINWCCLHKKILQSLYNATANLMVKRLNIRKMIEKIENDNSHKTNSNSKQKWRKLCAAFEHLTVSIQKVDAQIALHRDF